MRSIISFDGFARNGNMQSFGDIKIVENLINDFDFVII